MTRAERYVQLMKLAGKAEEYDCDYQAAIYLLSADEQIYIIACSNISEKGIDFLGIKAKARHLSECKCNVISVAQNLFTYVSICEVTPFEMARGLGKYLNDVFNAILISAERVCVIKAYDAKGKISLELKGK